MPESWGLPLFVLAVLVIFGWFVVGTQWNIRKGDKVLKWLRQGLPLVGERTTMRWLGSSALELKINKAQNPFRTAETTVIFEPRDIVLIWALERLRGRRDTLIFRAQLHSAPSFELEAFDPKGWTAGGVEKSAQSKNWKRLDVNAATPLVAYSSSQIDPATAKALIDRASRTGGQLSRLSVRRTLPNLELHWLLPDPGNCSARDLYMRLRQISEDIIKV